ncbi:MAG: hypothetical protein ACYCXT_14050 [Acidiferrobacteraceae bacterium]
MRDSSGSELRLLGPAHPEVLVLAQGLSRAVERDEAPEEGGFDMSAGLYGTHVSLWLRRLAADTLNARLREERLLRAARAALRYMQTRDQAADVVCEQLEGAITDCVTAGRSDSDVQSPGSVLQSREFG